MAARQAHLPLHLRRFLAISVAIVVACLACELYAHLHLGLPVSFHYRGNTPYTWPVLLWSHWRDFTCWIPRFTHIHTLQFFSNEPGLDQLFMYPAPGALIFYAFYSVPGRPLLFFLILTSCVVLIIAALFCRAMRRLGLDVRPAAIFISMTVVLSYPLWFEFDLANMEIWMAIFVLTGVWAFLREKPYLAATLFAIAAGCKIFPIIFLSLFISRRQYRPVFYAFALLLTLEFLGLWVMYPNLHVAWNGVTAGVNSFRIAYLLPDHFETGFDHSLFALFKVATDLLLRRFGNSVEFPPLNAISPFIKTAAALYVPVVITVGLLLYFKFIRKMPLVNQILSLTVIAILFPPVSHDYTLLHLYTPWGILVLLALEHRTQPRAFGLAFACFAICMAPETELIFHNQSLGGQIKCVSLVALLVISLRYRLPELKAAHHDPSCSSNPIFA